MSISTLPQPLAATNLSAVPSLSSAGLRLSRLLQEDLDFHGANGKFASHGWHPFPAKFPPQLSPIPAVKAVEVGFGVLEAAKARFAGERRGLEKELDEFFDQPSRKFVDYWFLPETQMELLALLGEIRKIRVAKIRRFFELAFSSTIIAKSGGVSLARDLAHTRPHKVEGKLPPSAFKVFLRRLGGMLGGGEAARRADFNLRQAGAAKTGVPENSVDLIVTSPPYANNAID